MADHTIIDGNNVIHVWDHLRALLRVDPSGETARARLVDMCAVLHDESPDRVTVVFDGGGDETRHEHPGEQDSFTVIWAERSLTADGVIERMAARSKHASGLVVVTGDNLVAESVRARGGTAMTPERFFSRVEDALRLQSKRLLRRNSASDNLFENRIPL